jgi:hypothetical protein
VAVPATCFLLFGVVLAAFADAGSHVVARAFSGLGTGAAAGAGLVAAVTSQALKG